MTQPVWPFPLVRPAGYVDGSVPTGPEIQALQERVAAAADGRVYTDVALLRNSSRLDASAFFDASGLVTAVRDPASKRWLIFGIFGGTTVVAYWSVAGRVWTYLGGIGGAVLSSVFSCAVSPAGVVLVGGAPPSSSTARILESTDGGATWTARNIGTAGTLAVRALAYSTSLGLWIASVGDATHDGILTSADRITWTLRAANQVPQYFAIAELPTTVILANAVVGAALTSYRRSLDGITWTTETFPENASSQQPCWSDAAGAFFMSGATGIWKSTTGLTGSWTKIYTGTEQASLGAFGRLLLRGDGSASQDLGVSWSPVTDLSGVTDCGIVTNTAGAMIFRRASRELYLSQQIGF